MKSSGSTAVTDNWIPAYTIIVLMLATSSSVSAQHASTTTHLRNFPDHHHRLLFSPSLHSLFIQRSRHHQPRPPPSGDDEIDPRYGVEKRLVPSGPNPLHN
ncbi:CLAVATA3/ESR (CLE)-related protein 10-like [Henckelia pumila]|uniref:CLAVATA3/ESR (CLE)-related protein 10-like n=1 Tax=Henckelia pumila TaxID=405737 RepID=UPI003C6E4F89